MLVELPAASVCESCTVLLPSAEVSETAMEKVPFEAQVALAGEERSPKSVMAVDAKQVPENVTADEVTTLPLAGDCATNAGARVSRL
jgi:hypothetical protein